MATSIWQIIEYETKQFSAWASFFSLSLRLFTARKWNGMKEGGASGMKRKHYSASEKKKESKKKERREKRKPKQRVKKRNDPNSL